jgi:hypothetical protein
MRDTLFGGGPSRGSVPNVPQRDSRPVWNSGQAMQQGQPGYGTPPYGQAYGQGPGQGYGAPPVGGGGGSFLGTAAAAAAGVVGGSLLLSSIRGMMGGSHQQAFGDTNSLGDRSASPWSGDQSGGSLARDAGLNDIGSRHRDEPQQDSRQGYFDQASNDDQDDDDDGFDNDDSDFGGGDDDGGSDYA